MRSVFTMLFFLSLSCSAYAQEFVREHTYVASDEDSKNDSRTAALRQMQIELLSEVGVYLESELLVRNTAYSKKVLENLKLLSAGVTRISIYQEKWDGRIYYIKAAMDIDVKDTLEKLRNAIKERSETKKLKRQLIVEKRKTMKLQSKLKLYQLPKGMIHWSEYP